MGTYLFSNNFSVHSWYVTVLDTKEDVKNIKSPID